ncbi:hypothetical protein KJ567_00040 [Candidatus Bipolaricaulota bacterium]|nr:hypothetical protein [Candidatus Bipolaricaulota bacterium]
MTYAEDAKASQVRWRTRHMADLPDRGEWRGKEYDHILPAEHWMRGVWPEIRDALASYLLSDHVQPHKDRHHLNSSWVLAANLYFPFRVLPSGSDVLAGALSEALSIRVSGIETIDLEFADPSPHDQQTLLGETGGSRGVGMTSPDIGIRYRDPQGRRGIVLIEVKYTEDNLQTCTEFKRLSSSERQACNDLPALLDDPSRCPYWQKGRRYIDVLEETLQAGEATKTIRRCPAATGTYQLLRQQALAESLVASGAYDTATSVLAFPASNAALRGQLLFGMPTGASVDDWGSLFGGRARFATLEHGRMVDLVKRRMGPRWVQLWLSYVRDRYFPGE